jgi:hypothetical protein
VGALARNCRAGFLLLAGLACVGCHAKPKQYWLSPEKRLEEATRDCRECNRLASAQAHEEHIRRYHESIEHGRPWQMDNEALEEANREMDEDRYFGACMRSRGYRQVSEHRLGPEIRKRNGFGGNDLQHLAGK